MGHDVSARDWQLKKPGGQWMAGKTFDTFAPIGIYLFLVIILLYHVNMILKDQQ